MADRDLNVLLSKVRQCQLCLEGEKPLPHAPRPVFQISAKARILLAGQAPGNLVNQTGRPFTDPSGDRLRDWLGVSSEVFYDPDKFVILPMGFCFPGYDKKGGDLPPRKECAPTWRERMLTMLPQIDVYVLIGGYAQAWHLKDGYAGNVTNTVENWRQYAPRYYPVPHPSWRNNAWLKRHSWFEDELLPDLQATIKECLWSS